MALSLFTKKELEESELLLVAQADGSYHWASHRSAAEVAAHLVKLAAAIAQEASDG